MNPVAEASNTALIIVDHGSRREESNDLLLQLAEAYRSHSGRTIVEPAHMELAEPSVATAFARCVEQGAQQIVVFPYFLGPGRHWSADIPRLVAEAAAPFGERGIRYLVTAPIGLHPLMFDIMTDRIAHCVERVGGSSDGCDVCSEGGGCVLMGS
jgi:sirohydrochlorin ferrochelatase